jgi:hypothetical protein
MPEMKLAGIGTFFSFTYPKPSPENPVPHNREVINPLLNYKDQHYPETTVYCRVIAGNDPSYIPGDTVTLVGVGAAARHLAKTEFDYITAAFLHSLATPAKHMSNPLNNHPLGEESTFKIVFNCFKHEQVSNYAQMHGAVGDPANPSVSRLKAFVEAFPEFIRKFQNTLPAGVPLPETPGEKLLALYQQLFPALKPLEPDDVLTAVSEKRFNLLEGTIETEPLF